MPDLLKRFVLCLLVLMACTFTGAAVAQDSAQVPRLVLVLSIDQMRADYLTRFDDLFEGGLRTLVDEGAVFTNAMYRHASTETGPGHAVIMSGRHPSSSGIVGNAWFDRLLGRSVNVIDDPFVRAVGGGRGGASPDNFVGFNLGDALKQANPESKVVSVSIKDRSAILMGGRLADGAFWYETTDGHFATSSYYMDEAPSWLDDWNDREVPDSYYGQVWTRLIDDESVYLEYAGPDHIEGEWDRVDTTFPHEIRGNPPEQLFYNDLQRFPFSDRVTAELALLAMDEYDLGADDATDVFAVGLSGGDYVGHTYGPDSQEVMDQILRLDLLLGDFLDEIDDRVGLDRTLVVLTADHGALPLVEVLQAEGVDSRRVDPRGILETVIRALGDVYQAPEELIASFGARAVNFDVDRLREREIPRREIEEVTTAALMELDAVAAVYTHQDLAGSEPSDDPYLWLYRNAFFPARSAHLTVRLRPYLYPSREFAGGTGHGTAYEYDRHVPIIFMGEGIRSGTFSDDSGPEDISPTLALILGLEDYPKEPDARILTELFD